MFCYIIPIKSSVDVIFKFSANGRIESGFMYHAGGEDLKRSFNPRNYDIPSFRDAIAGIDMKDLIIVLVSSPSEKKRTIKILAVGKPEYLIVDRSQSKYLKIMNKSNILKYPDIKEVANVYFEKGALGLAKYHKLLAYATIVAEQYEPYIAYIDINKKHNIIDHFTGRKTGGFPYGYIIIGKNILLEPAEIPLHNLIKLMIVRKTPRRKISMLFKCIRPLKKTYQTPEEVAHDLGIIEKK